MLNRVERRGSNGVQKNYLKDEDETEDRESSDDDNNLEDILIRDRWETGKLV